jgi:Ca2+/H+ antiporter, TMEM165/GDT1 family
MNLGVICVVFGVIFFSELPDKSMFASLTLGMRYRGLYVWAGAATAFLVHVLIAVSLGQVLGLLPHRLVASIVAVLFLGGALLLYFGRHNIEQVAKSDDDFYRKTHPGHTFWKVYGTSFAIIFLGEWGDITQIATANYTAHYHAPLSVAIGAILALWTVTALAIKVGRKLIQRVPVIFLHRAIGTVLLLFAIISGYSALRG